MNSKRLLAIASLIEQDDKIVDIGCDHAYLDIYLIKNNLCESAIASDISANALNQAKLIIAKYELNDKIDTVISNGLEDITGNFNTIVISGMGTNTILGILNNEKVKYAKKIIIQSNNNLEELRTSMNKNNFKIVKEIVVKENNKFYSILLYVPGIEKLSKMTRKFGIYNKQNIEYYNYLYVKNQKILKRIPWYKFIKRFPIFLELLYLKKLKN